MKEVREVKDIEKILKSLANGRRVRILKYLDLKKKAGVGEIADAIKLSFKATSKHLLILYSAGLVDKEQKSLTMIYSLSEPKHKIISATLSS